jgi:hypothetical protein
MLAGRPPHRLGPRDYLFSINDYIVVATKEPQEATHAAS